MQAAEEQDKVVRFYDQFAEKQEKTGINSRHLSILDKAKQAGLKSNHRILEVGCGIGTVSHLLATQVPQGKLLAVDISPEKSEIGTRSALLPETTRISLTEFKVEYSLRSN